MLVLGGSTGLHRIHVHRSQLVHPFPYIAIHYVMAMKLTLTWPLKCAPSPQNQGLLILREIPKNLLIISVGGHIIFVYFCWECLIPTITHHSSSYSPSPTAHQRNDPQHCDLSIRTCQCEVFPTKLTKLAINELSK